MAWFSSLVQAWNDRAGAVAPLFALGAVGLIGIAGVAMDTMVLVNARARANDAVLAALGPTELTKSQREAVAQEAFRANLPPRLRNLNPDFDVKVKENAHKLTAEAEYSLDHPVFLAGLFVSPTVVVRGVAEAAVSHAQHLALHLWLDGSASMGIAADEAGRDALRALSAGDPEHQNCAFACHIPTGLAGGYTTSAERAHDNGIQLRVDVMKSSALAMIDGLEEIKDDGGDVTFTVQRFDQGAQEVLGATNDWEDARDAVSAFSLGGPSWAAASSHLNNNIASAAAALPTTPGAGTNSDPRHLVVLATDGMQFEWDAIPNGPIDPTKCDAAKDRGIMIAVIHLRYVDLTPDAAFMHWVGPHHANLEPALQACATPGLFFAASTPAEIEKAFKDLAVKALNSLRLTK